MGVKKNIKKAINELIPGRFKLFLNNQAFDKPTNHYKKYINLSFSQEGEDLILHRIIKRKNAGFYVDIGAHHPFRYSNTYKFYRLGWRGINLDPLPGSMELFRKYRPNDINLEIPISNLNGELVYYMFDEPALNSFDKKNALKFDTETKYKIINRLNIKTEKLKDILALHLPANTEIDFFSIDVEGLDYSVLLSNDWELYRPSYIIAESLSTNLAKDMDSDISKFLSEKNYQLIAKTFNSLIYANNEIKN